MSEEATLISLLLLAAFSTGFCGWMAWQRVREKRYSHAAIAVVAGIAPALLLTLLCFIVLQKRQEPELVLAPRTPEQNPVEEPE